MTTSQALLFSQSVERSGTVISSFDYKGQRQNILFGSNAVKEISNECRDIVNLDKNLGHYNGETYLFGLDNNRGRTIRAFRIDLIQNMN